MSGNGVVSVVSSQGEEIFSHSVEEGDIWRMCQTKDAPIKDWVGLAVSRARDTGAKTIFWLDPARGHDANLSQAGRQLERRHASVVQHCHRASPVTQLGHQVCISLP